MAKKMKKLVKWATWFEAAQKKYGKDPRESRALRWYLENNGFFSAVGGISQNVWINYEKRVVIKRPYLSKDGLMRHKAARDRLIPTLDLDGGWLVQPLCDTNRKYAAQQTILKDVAHIHCYRDLHAGNVGHYRGRAVIFDW